MKLVILLDTGSTLTINEWHGDPPAVLLQALTVKARLGEMLVINDAAGRPAMAVPASRVASLFFDYMDDASQDLAALLERGRTEPPTPPGGQPA